MRNPILQFVWQALVAYGSFWIWVFTIPYNIAKMVSPDFTDRYVYKFGEIAETIFAPIINGIETFVYYVLSTIDAFFEDGMRGVTRVHNANMQHFKVAMEAYLRLVEHKARIIEQHGLKGIPEAFSAKAA